jgi:hypothetical protein
MGLHHLRTYWSWIVRSNVLNSQIHLIEVLIFLFAFPCIQSTPNRGHVLLIFGKHCGHLNLQVNGNATWRFPFDTDYQQVIHIGGGQARYSNSHFVWPTSVNRTIKGGEYEPITIMFPAFLDPGYDLTKVVCSLIRFCDYTEISVLSRSRRSRLVKHLTLTNSMTDWPIRMQNLFFRCQSGISSTSNASVGVIISRAHLISVRKSEFGYIFAVEHQTVKSMIASHLLPNVRKRTRLKS